MSAFAYARFSTDRQSETSIEDQVRVCRELAARLGLELEEPFVDRGISGAALGNRPALLRVLDRLEHGDTLLVATIDRLSRSQDLGPLVERLRFRGVRILGALDAFDSQAATARMHAGFSGLASAELRAAIAARTRSALELRARTGRATGGRAYGFDSSGAVVEPEAAIVLEVFQRYAAGETLRAIASDLNLRGVASPGADWQRERRRHDGRWLVSALHALLRNERYAGRIVWNRSTWSRDPDTGARVRRERPPADWIVGEGPVIVPPELWQAVERRHAARAPYGPSAGGNGRGGAPRYLLSGLLRCGVCGAALIVSGKGGAAYYCASHRAGGPAACSVDVGARRDVAEARIVGRVRDRLLSPEAVAIAVDEFRRLAREELAAVQAAPPEVAAIDAEIAELEELARARPALAASLRAALEAAHDRRRAALRAAWRRAHARPDPGAIAAERAYREACERASETLAGDTGRARELLREIIGEVRVEPEAGRRGLVAHVGPNPVPLWRAAGLESAWVGSGGRI